jgi:hypothetical protein
MSKIIISQVSRNTIKLKLPAELQYYMSLNKSSRFIYINFTQDPANPKNKMLIIKNNYYYSYDRSNYEYLTYVQSKRRTQILINPTIKLRSNRAGISSLYTHNNIDGICDVYNLDYTIYENGSEYCIIAKFKVDKHIDICGNNISGFSKISNNIINKSFDTYSIDNASALDEFYHYVKEENNTITYLTKAKYLQAVVSMIKAGYDNEYANDNVNDFTNYMRTVSYSKFFIKSFKDFDEKKIQAYLEYNKMLNSYDPELFEIVSGEKIEYYYHYNNYFKNSGELGSSCMRNDANQSQIRFYALNNNVSLIVMKPKGLNSILGRALLWTTTDGTKVMDRIYVCDTKLISLFHRYASENGFINIYNHRKWASTGNRDITKMSPAYWENKYDKNFIVDLNYIPSKVTSASYRSQYDLHINRQTSINSPSGLPYLDNFNLLNSETSQLSVSTLKDTFKCPLSGKFVNQDNVLYSLEQVYDINSVRNINGSYQLLPDIVSLDDDDLEEDEWLEELDETEEQVPEITMTNNNNNDF